MSKAKRIQEIVDYYGMSYNSFAISIGMLNGTSIKRIVDDNRNPQNQTLNKISSAYPEINMHWLNTGSGTMIKGDEVKLDVDDLTLTSKQIFCKLDEDNLMYIDMLSKKLDEDRNYYSNDSPHVKDIKRIFDGFLTLESKVEYNSKHTIEIMTKAITEQNKLLLNGHAKIANLETELEDIKTFMAANFALDEINKKHKKKDLQELNERRK
tara:strand:+ start:71 stop:700 length:630 start_codon:yes stop_codon:yes gene_type:complete